MTGAEGGEAVARAFGADNRERLLKRYFAEHPAVGPQEAWRHVYRLLLWIDRTTGLAHCYESDKSQPGRPWYERSLRFHSWVSKELGATPGSLPAEVDWLFREASKELARGVSERRRELAAKQRAVHEGEGFPEPGEDPELEQILQEELAPWLRQQPPPEVLRRLADRIHEHTRLENKRKNLVGEGFEDVLAMLIGHLPRSGVSRVITRSYLHDIPGFYEPPGGEKPRKVDLALVSGKAQHRSLVTVKWSIRADREEQFMSDFRIYARLERAGQPFDYVLVTNEFDPARLAAACERQHEGRPMFKEVVHVNPAALAATYGSDLQRSFEKATDHIASRRITSLADWLQSLQP